MPEHSGQSYVSATYLLTSVPDFLESITYRMLADGMILQDIRLAASIAEWSEWGDFWIRRALEHEQLALNSFERSYAQTAGEHLVRASLCAHYGQFLYFEYPETKRQAAELKARLFRKAAPLRMWSAVWYRMWVYRRAQSMRPRTMLPTGGGIAPSR